MGSRFLVISFLMGERQETKTQITLTIHKCVGAVTANTRPSGQQKRDH